MVTQQQFDTGKVERSKVTRYKRGVTKTKIIYTSSVDQKKRVIIFPYVAVVLRGDQIEFGLKPGTQLVVFGKTSQWAEMVALLREEYNVDVTALTMDQINAIGDIAARRDAEFAKSIEELETYDREGQPYEVTKIYDVTQDIIYHVQT